jgi:hypothetical protein
VKLPTKLPIGHPSPTAAGGEFFIVDRRTFSAACALGLNPAIAYLTIARGAGSRQKSAWSVHAIERYTGISRPKARIAIDTLIDGQLIKLERAGTSPVYEISTAHQPEATQFSADERIVLKLFDEKKELYVPRRHRATAIGLASRGFLIAETNGWYSKRSDAFSSGPQPIWLPNALVDGAADETPPLALLRQMQDVRRLKLFVTLYNVNNLPNDGGVARAILYEEHPLKMVSQRGPLTIWGFNSAGTTVSTSSTPLHSIFLTGQKNDKGDDTGLADFWSALEGFGRCGLMKFVPHVFESDKPEAEMLHAYATERDVGETWEHGVADAAHNAALVNLEPTYRDWATENDFRLLPVPSHISNVAVIGIARLRYRPQTRMTAAWFAMSKERSQAWQTTYELMVQRQNSLERTGGFDVRTGPRQRLGEIGALPSRLRVPTALEPVGIQPIDNTPKGSKPDGEAPSKQSTPPAEMPEKQKPSAPPKLMTRADWLRRRRQEEEEEAAAKAAKARAQQQAGAPTTELNGTRPVFAGPELDEEEEEPSAFRRKSPAPAA